MPLVKLETLMQVYKSAQDIRVKEPEKFKKIKFGIPSIDAITEGITTPSYSVIVAQNKSGKTAFMITLAPALAEGDKNVVCIISEEMNFYQMASRISSNLAMVDMDRFENMETDATDWIRFDNAMAAIKDCNIFVEYGVRTKTGIQSIIDLLKSSFPGKKIFIIIDYAQLMQPEEDLPRMDDYKFFTGLSQWMKNITLPQNKMENNVLTPEYLLGIGENNVSVITAVQVAKSEKRNKVGNLTDASGRGTGSWEDDADYLFVINLVKDDDGDPIPDMRKITIGGRYTKGGDVKVTFRRSQARFEDIQDPDKVQPIF